MLNANDTVLHVIPVVVKNPESPVRDAECVQKALKAASHLHLVSEDELDTLQARVHVDRRGPLTPVGDILQVRQQAQKRNWKSFIRLHKTLRCVPATATSISARLGSMEDVVTLIDAQAEPAKKRGTYKAHIVRSA